MLTVHLRHCCSQLSNCNDEGYTSNTLNTDSSAGKASHLQAGGCRFEPSSGCNLGGCGFIPLTLNDGHQAFKLIS